jgi:hypothetical protein
MPPKRTAPTRQLGHVTGHDRQHVGLEVAALVEEGADRRDIGRKVEMALSRIKEAAAEVLDRHETKQASSRVRRTLDRNFVTNLVTRRLNFVTNFVTPSISALARGTIGMLAWSAAAVGWGIAKFPTRFDRRSDDFLCGTGISERCDNLREQGGECHRRFPKSHGCSKPASNIDLANGLRDFFSKQF